MTAKRAEPAKRRRTKKSAGPRREGALPIPTGKMRALSPIKMRFSAEAPRAGLGGKIKVLDAEQLDRFETSDAEVIAEYLGKSTPLLSKVCHLLLRSPKAYGELRRGTGIEHDNNLTVALKRLREEGIIERLPNPGGDQTSAKYALTDLGLDGYLEFYTERRLSRVLNAARRGLVPEAESAFAFEAVRRSSQERQDFLIPYKRPTQMQRSVIKRSDDSSAIIEPPRQD